MSNKKDITIKSSAFSLIIHWNSQAILTQVCILAACVACLIFVNNDKLKMLAKVLIALDVASVFVGLFVVDKESKVSTEEQSSEDNISVEIEVDVSNEKDKKVESHSSTSIKEGKINNRLEIATPKKPTVSSSREQQTETPQPTQQPDSTPSIPADVSAALADFFDFDFDDDE